MWQQMKIASVLQQASSCLKSFIYKLIEKLSSQKVEPIKAAVESSGSHWLNSTRAKLSGVESSRVDSCRAWLCLLLQLHRCALLLGKTLDLGLTCRLVRRLAVSLSAGLEFTWSTKSFRFSIFRNSPGRSKQVSGSSI